MKIYIEMIVVFVLVSFLILWKIWSALSRRLLLRKYNPDNDKSRKGELNRREIAKIEREKPTIGTTVSSSDGHEQPEERRGILPKANVGVTRKNSSGVRGFLKRRRRRN